MLRVNIILGIPKFFFENKDLSYFLVERDLYCICWCGVSMDVGGEVVGAAILREKYLKILGQYLHIL